MKKYSKTFNINLIKQNFPYYVSDIVEKLGVTKGTVYAWIEEGLQPIDDRSTYIIINGSELRRFLKARQDNRKHPCKNEEMFCLKCQLPRRPLEGKASIQTREGCKPSITGKCIVCNSQMYRAINLKNLPEIAKTFKLEELPDIHLVESVAATINHNKNTGE